MTPLTFDENEHLKSFAISRPDWRVLAMSQRLVDEDITGRGHKYARTHPYITGMQYVMSYFRNAGECKVLDIGSPLQQNVALSCMPDVEVTVLDVRENDDADMLGLRWVKGSASSIPYPAESWDFVTSLWVMGHVGDGRYGDALDVNGDRKMISEIARVLRPGGVAIIGPGLVSTECGNIFNLHRIYTWEWLLAEFERAGLYLIEKRDLHVSEEVYFDVAGENLKVHRRDGRYGLARLTKL